MTDFSINSFKRQKMRIFQFIGSEWIFLLLLGMTMALLSFVMDYTIQKCQRAHFWLFAELEHYSFLQYLAWVFFPLVFIMFSVGFVQIVSSQAIGSGIPEIKTIMRGVEMPEYLTLRTVIAKMVGLSSALGSRLPIGKEGPFVHIASIVATLLNKLLSNFSAPFESESEMLAAACAVGVACNFAAPIGGVLFSIEVTATYFAVRNYWRAFFSAVCGALVFRLLAVWNEEEETITALFKTNFRIEFPYDLQELLAFVAIGIVSGFAGALFVYIHRQLVEFNRNNKILPKFFHGNRFLYPVVISLAISSMTYPNGIGQFMAGELTLKEALDTLFDNKTWAKLGYIDESIVLNDVQAGWKHPTVNIYVTLVVFIISHFLMTVVAITLAVPCGVFMPIFLIGAAFGRLVGESMAAFFPDGFYSGTQVYPIVPGGYAVVGAASLSGAVTHTISTSVIVFELTGQISHILPVMIAVLIANVIAQWLQPSIYDSIILIKSLPYLPDIGSSKKHLCNVYVEDFMIHEILYITCSSSYKDLQGVISKSKFKILPLVDSHDSMILIGSVPVSNLEELLKYQLNTHTSVNFKYTVDTDKTNKILDNSNYPNAKEKGNSMGAYLREIAPLINNTESNASDNNVLFKPVDFDNCKIDPSPFQLAERTSLHKAHTMFSLLGLDFAYVTRFGKLIGILSLQELTYGIMSAEENTQNQAKYSKQPLMRNNASEEIELLTDSENDSDG